MDSTEIMAAMGITGFGKQVKKRELDPARFDKSKREERPVTPSSAKPEPKTESSTPARPSRTTTPEEDGDRPWSPPGDVEEVGSVDQDEPEFDPDEMNDMGVEFPISHEIALKDHTKVISALAVDPSGARIVSGSHDYDCKLWDFGGMDHRCSSFHTWEPAGSYHIRDLKWSNDGQEFLCISGNLQPKLYDRDGEEIATFIKGDPYIRDMKHTNGHVSEVTSCAWHPKDPKLFITSSADSTIRIWDKGNKRKQKTVIVVKSKDRGARTKIVACTYSPDGNIIGGSCLDGALHLWNTNTNFVRPNLSIENAHVKGTEAGSMVFSIDGRTILTRGGDDTVKLWDIRAFKKPLAARADLTTLYPNTNAVFSPDDKYIITGAGSSSKGRNGRLLFLRKDNLDIEKELVVDATPVKVVWHPKINQVSVGIHIVCGTLVVCRFLQGYPMVKYVFCTPRWYRSVGRNYC
ncbi:hypothetical protein AX15_005749 [Amanita polypyramis BW_CC]|nr:hypothetical protein AX15_005749 [Amanita polypyramis BW_CC]